MAPPRTYRCEAIILSYTPLGEADLLVTMFTRDQGKVRAVGKGARRSTSKLVGHLEPLTLMRMSMAHGRSMDIISQAEVVQSFSKLKEDLTGITKGLYLAELVDGFGAEDSANPELYRLMIETLLAIETDPESDMPLRFFEFHLLQVSGLMPELYHCVECRAELEPDAHRFSPNVGGTLCLDCNPEDAHLRLLSLRALKVLRLLDRSDIAAACKLSLDDSLAAELKSLLSTTVSYWLGKEIRSNSFLERLNNESLPEVYI
ncbi:MAG: DNA repair protein RecO [Chloroflexi bacterium]|jgi:DNA repair protein RecO (recombination protein O)|nr:DNA repair protein RecO [Chloroflexota bacterium]MDP6498940.1 DNA repair protein RecO [Dehalococcoidia bacterium]MQG56094.1 DNA repair protein RecO [SAR202 cluster bacterium]|tara:strand:- start:1160 stop:1939 length:780 start_codon:yes stop_codon:yes gene_type:complete